MLTPLLEEHLSSSQDFKKIWITKSLIYYLAMTSKIVPKFSTKYLWRNGRIGRLAISSFLTISRNQSEKRSLPIKGICEKKMPVELIQLIKYFEDYLPKMPQNKFNKPFEICTQFLLSGSSNNASYHF